MRRRCPGNNYSADDNQWPAPSFEESGTSLLKVSPLFLPFSSFLSHRFIHLPFSEEMKEWEKEEEDTEIKLGMSQVPGS